MFCLFLWFVPQGTLLLIEKYFPNTIPYFEKIEFIKEFNARKDTERAKKCKEMQKEAINNFKKTHRHSIFHMGRGGVFFLEDKKCKVPKIITDKINIYVIDYNN